MSTAKENLITRRDAVAAEIATIDSTNPGGRPNISGGGQGTVDHAGYKRGLYEELRLLNEQIAALEDPWEISVEGLPQ